MNPSAVPPTRVHLVLGAGGARTLAYVGALEVLSEAGIEFASISACSAGSLVGAFLATGVAMPDMRRRIEEIDLRRLLAHSTFPGVLRYAARLRWPFAPFDSEAVVQIMDDLMGAGLTFGELQIPFATAGIDVLAQQLLVYSSVTHASMKVADAVRIAVGIPLLFPPHEAGGRVVVDAAIATQCPIWMVGRFDDELPIVVLKPADTYATAPPRRVDRFLEAMLGAGVACRDRYLIDEIPRARLLEIPIFDLAADAFADAEQRKPYLFEAGRRAAEAALRDWGPGLAPDRKRPARRSPRAGHEHDDRAVMTASGMMQGFANRLSRFSRKQLFISYSHRDRPWLDVVKVPLEPYMELSGLQVWEDTQIAPGERWREAIDQALASTRVALLLVSPGLLDSRFVRDEELAYFVDAAQRLAVTIHWVLLSDIGERPNPLAEYQALLDTSRPLDTLGPRDLVLALAAVARALAAALDER